MSDLQKRALSGSCLGGIAGLIAGALIGGIVGSWARSDWPQNGPVDPRLVDSCLGFFGMIVGIAVGGIVGALGGSILGVGFATTSQPNKHLDEKTDADPR